jgi:sugar phosphate permease
MRSAVENERPTGDPPLESKLNYRWLALGIGALAQMTTGLAFFPGLAAIGPAIASWYHLNLVQMGVLFGTLQFGPVLTIALWGVVADGRGDRFALGTGLGLGAAALASAWLVHSFALLVIVLAVASMLMASTNVASTRAAAQWFSADERGLALGIRQMSVPVGGIVAALMLPALSQALGTPFTFLVVAAICGLVAAIAIVALSRRPDRQLAPPQNDGVAAWRDRRLWRLAIGVGLLIVCQNSLLAYFVLFLAGQRHMSPTAAALVFLVTQLGGSALRVLLGMISDRTGSRIRPLRWLALAVAALMLVAAASVDLPLVVVIPVLVVGVVLGMSSPGLAYTATAEIAGLQRAGAAIGFEITVFAIGGTFAPILFGLAVTGIGWRGAFALVAVCAVAGWLILARLARLEKRGWVDREHAPALPAMAPAK